MRGTVSRINRAYYRAVRQRLRMAQVEFVSVDSRLGFELPGVVNSRTGSEFHSAVEAQYVLDQRRSHATLHAS